MRVIAVSTLKAFWLRHPDAEQPLKAWVGEARAATWKSPSELKGQFRSASTLPAGRVIFNIAGNRFRLVVAILYASQIVLIKFVGTHREYDAINPQTVESPRRS